MTRSDLGRLFHLQALQWRNGWRSDARGRRRRIAAMLAVPLFAAASLVGTRLVVQLSGILQLYSLAEVSDMAQRSATSLTLEGLSLSITITFVVLCLGAVDQAYETFYLAHDGSLLLAAPISRRAVFWYRLALNLRWDGGMVAVLGIPIALGLGAWLGAPAAYFIVLPIGWLLLLAIVSGLGTGLAMVLTRFLPAPRLRQVMLTFMLTLGLAMVAGLQGLVTGLWTRDGIVRLLEINALSRQLWLPPVWLGRALTALLQHQWREALPWLLALLAGAAASLVLAQQASHRCYTIGWSNAQEGRQARQAAKRRRPSRRAASPLGAVLRKDLLVFARQPVQWYQAALGTLAIAMVLINFAGQQRSASSAVMITLVMSYVGASTFAMNLSLRAVSSEGLSWWLLQLAPLSHRQLLLAKLLTAWVPTASYALASLLIMQAILGVRWTLSLATAPILLVMVSSMIVIDLWVGLWRTDFDQASETRNADILAVLLSQGLNYVLLGPAVLLLALPPVLENRGYDTPLAALLLITGLAALVMTALAWWLPGRWSLRILEALRLSEPPPSLRGLLRPKAFGC
jgi:hypothetical protein